MQASFSEANRARYKKLASGSLTAVERRAILELLATELANQLYVGTRRA